MHGFTGCRGETEMTKAKDGALRVTNHDYEWSPKYYGVIAGLFCAIYMITMALGNKLFTLGFITTSAGLLTFPICTIISDMLTEVYGFNRTRQVIWTAMAGALLFSVFTYVAVLLPPASFWPNQEAFATSFSTTWRLAFGGIAAWAVGEFSNSFIMSRMKILQEAKHMPLRFVGSTVVAQFFDTLTVGLIAFSGLMPWGDWTQMLLVSWAIKVAYEIVLLPLSVPLARWIKRLEGIEHFDRQKLRIV